MKIPFKRPCEKTKERIIKVADALTSVASLLFIFRAVSLVYQRVDSSAEYLAVYLLLGFSCFLRAFASFRKNRLNFIKNLCFGATWILSGSIVAVIGTTRIGSIILIESLLAILLASCVIRAITAVKKRYKVMLVLLALFLAYTAVEVLFQDTATIEMFMLLHALTIFLKVLGHIIAVSFSQIRLGVLRKILKKTFAAEILFGMLLLILAFSFVFTDMEPGIKSFDDALWYCFAVVTTIGFGDITVVSPFSRALSVILGCYGIIFVALITSVIVNFYNEVKNDADPDEEKPLPQESSAAQSSEPAGQTADNNLK